MTRIGCGCWPRIGCRPPRWPGSSNTWSSARSAGTRSIGWSATTAVWERSAAISGPTRRSRTSRSAAADGSLDFLAPSDWPDSLGRLGTYEVKGVLGRGGMGVVLKAFDPALSRNVAIKVMSAPLATCGAARQRFLREARAAAAVVHEHVVGVFAVVESAGLPFLVMEYVPGRSLQDRLDKHGPLSLPEVLRIGMQTAAGLAAAHAQGLVHRDVKPANILLEERRRAGAADRLRPGPRRGRRRDDPQRRGGRDPALHGPRAGSRRDDRSSRRPLQPGEHALRDVCRPSAVPGRDAAGRAPARLRRRAAPAPRDQPRRPRHGWRRSSPG